MNMTADEKKRCIEHLDSRLGKGRTTEVLIKALMLSIDRSLSGVQLTEQDKMEAMIATVYIGAMRRASFAAGRAMRDGEKKTRIAATAELLRDCADLLELAINGK